MTENTVMEFIPGKMGVNMKVTGIMVNSTEKEFTDSLMVRPEKENGKMAKE